MLVGSDFYFSVVSLTAPYAKLTLSAPWRIGVISQDFDESFSFSVSFGVSRVMTLFCTLPGLPFSNTMQEFVLVSYFEY